MKVLVTGSSGHLGEALVRVLNERGIETLGLDILPSEHTDKVGSLVDRELVKKCMKDIDCVMHTATLHKPHVGTHSKQDFIDTNITGTLNLLEEAKLQGVKSFIFTSTTSTFGDALSPSTSEPSAWITEETVPVSKNIYGVTKNAAENLCQLFYRNHQLPCIILKTSRFFLEIDDKKHIREKYENENIKANEFLNRRVDIEDIVESHILAMEKAAVIGFSRYIISATPPFEKEDLKELRNEAPVVLERKFPEYKAIYDQLGWEMFPGLDRVYVNEKARKELNWQPKYDFGHVLNSLKEGKSFHSALAQSIGVKFYHNTEFEEGPYPV